MTPDAMVTLGTLVVASSVLLFAVARGFTLSELSAFGVNLNLPAITISPIRFLATPALAIFVAGAATFAMGMYQKIFPETWPTHFSELKSAQLWIYDVDDDMLVRVNGQVVARVNFGQAAEWVDIYEHLHKGMNIIEYVIMNGQYGGCGGNFAVSLNGMQNKDFHWSWSVYEDKMPGVVCFQGTKTLALP